MWIRERLKENQKVLKRRARRRIAKRILLTSGSVAIATGIASKMKSKYTVTS